MKRLVTVRTTVVVEDVDPLTLKRPEGSAPDGIEVRDVKIVPNQFEAPAFDLTEQVRAMVYDLTGHTIDEIARHWGEHELDEL